MTTYNITGTLTITGSSGKLTLDVIIPTEVLPTPGWVVNTKTYATLKEAVVAALPNSVITGDPTNVYNDYGVYINKPLTIKSSVPGTRVKIDASSVAIPGGGAIIGVDGVDLTLIDLHLTGNKFEYNYNPGVTSISNSGNIYLKNCLIEDCSNGILSGKEDITSDWYLSNCEIRDNGDWNGLTHNIYINKCNSLTVDTCLIHNTKTRTNYDAASSWRESWGHLVKSRSKTLTIINSQLLMGVYSSNGGANRCVDYPNGGNLTITGSTLEYKTNQNVGRGQAIAWGVEGTDILTGGVFDNREFKINLHQNTIIGASPGVDGNQQCMWIGVGCTFEGTGEPTPAPTSYSVQGNTFIGWTTNPPLVIEGPKQTLSTLYAFPLENKNFQWNEVNTPIFFDEITKLAGGGFQGSNPIGAIVDAYSTPAYDQNNDILYFYGGGHSDGNCNGIYKFDLKTLTYSEVVKANSENARPSTHTYGSLVFDDNKLHVYFKSVGSVDLLNKSWDIVENTNPYGPQLLQQQLAYSDAYLQEGTYAVVDPITHFHYVTNTTGSAGDNFRGKLLKINPKTKTLSAPFNVGTNTYTQMQLIGRNLHVFTPIVVNDVATYNTDQICNLDDETFTVVYLQNPPSFNVNTSGIETIPSCTDGTSFYFYNYLNKNVIYKLTENTFTSIFVIDNGLPNFSYHYKLHYFAARNSILILPNSTSKFWELKL